MVNRIKAIEIKDYIGKKFYTRWYEVSQEAINKFADLTKDHQYIHINPERAERSIYGKTVAHGFFTLSMLGFFTLQDGDRDSMQFYISDAKAILNYGFEKLNLPRLICLIDKNNISSIRIAEKIGMVFEKEGEDEKGPFMLFSISNPTALKNK